MAKRKRYQIPQHLLIEQMRVYAQRQAQQIGGHGWRPHKDDLRDLRESLKDARAYRVLAKSWRRAGFRISTIRKFAGRRTPADRGATTRHFAAGQMEQ
jgi:uncharacterized protein (DUF2461 family)